MKKLLFGAFLVAGTTLVFAGNGKVLKAKNFEKKENQQTCSVSCSTTVTNPSTGASITYTMTAGNIFTSCATAQQRCSSKMKMTLGMEPTGYEL